MSLKVFDAFCGAGGSSWGASRNAGVEVVMAANHWQKAIDVHQANFPETRHDCADLSAVDFRRYLACDIFIASPECTNHSASRGVSRKAQNPSLWDAPDPSAERSRATMWDVHRYVEAHRPAAVIVENVVDAAGWLYWPSWWQAFADAGYTARVLSINSMHVPAGSDGVRVPQSRDRIYVVATRDGIRPNLELTPAAWCASCERVVEARQRFKRADRHIGRYRQSWLWRCPECSSVVEPPAAPALQAIDWDLPSQRIGDRAKPLAAATLRRIRIGLERYGIAVVQGAGHTFERASSGYARCWDAAGPLPTQVGTILQGVATPPAAFIDTARQHAAARPVTEALRTVEAGGNHHAVVELPFLVRQHTPRSEGCQTVFPAGDPSFTVTAMDRTRLLLAPVVVETAHQGDDASRVRSTREPFRTMTADDDRPLVVDAPEAFYVRNFAGNAGRSMVHDVRKPLGAMTAKDHTALLVPYNRTGVARSVREPAHTVETRDRLGLLHPEVSIDDCTFRMLEPHEVGRAMAFPDVYEVDGTKKERVKLYGNAVTPPVMEWIVGRVAEALA